MATITKPIALDESLNTSETPSRNIADVLAQELANLSTAVKPNASNILMSDNVTTVEQAIDAINDFQTFNEYLSGNTSKTFSLGKYGVALVICGSPNRTQDLTGIYLCTMNTNPYAIKSSSAYTVTDSGSDKSITVATTVNTYVTVLFRELA